MEKFGNSITYGKSRSSDDMALNISDMDTLEETGSKTKRADSVYSNSYSNSNSRSHRSNSGSNFSGSSGYGGKPSTSGSSSDDLVQTPKKDAKKKKQSLSQTEAMVDSEHCFLDCLLEGMPQESIPFSGVNKELTRDASPADIAADVTAATLVDMTVSSSGLSSYNDKIIIKTNYVSLETSCEVGNTNSDGFSCAISLQDGVVIYITRSVISKLGFPKDLWIGRSFVDFIHPKDHSTFVTQMTKALAIPAVKVKSSEMDECSMVCRIRRYRSLESGFGVKDKNVTYLPFVLKFSFNIQDGKVAYMIITATSVYSAFKTRNECLANATPFTMRHSATGIVDYIDIASVPYLGYLPQDIQNQNALLLCHPEDLRYLKTVYEAIVKEGSVAKSLPYRMLAQNGDYVKLQSEWSSFKNPWSKKLEFVAGKYYILEGPTTPDVFMPPQLKSTSEYSTAIAKRADLYVENILKVLSNILRNPEEDKPKLEEKPKADSPNPGPDTFDKDSMILGALSPHSDCMTSVRTPMSYNQLNYNENLQRFFDSQPYCFDENISLSDGEATVAPELQDPKQLVKATSNSLVSPMSQCSGEPLEQNPPTSPSALELQLRNLPHNDFYSTRLTETLLNKHDTEMQKEFTMNHRECRYTNKSVDALDSRQKTIEHLARCNASFQPTETAEATQLRGFKRASTAIEKEIAQKRPCLQQPCQVTSVEITAARLQPTTTVDVLPMNHLSAAVSTTIPMDSSHWPDAESTNIPQTHQMPPFPSVPMSCPDSPPSHSTPYDFKEQQAFNAYSRSLEQFQVMSINPSEFATTSYLQITKRKPELPKGYKISQRQDSDDTVRTDGKSSSSSFPSSFTTSSYSAGNRNTKQQKTSRPLVRSGSSRPNSDETFRTDGDSSCSSFYSSFFNTESSSTGISIAPKKSRPEIVKMDTVAASPAPPPYYYTTENRQPWSDLANMNTELEFRYQVPLRSKEEILKADAERFENLIQPPLVKEQLGQMFLQMQLASRLALEDGNFSSSRFSDESNFSVPRPLRSSRKESKSKLQMIYEEDAPIPSPSTGFEASSSESSDSPPEDLESSSDEPPESPPADFESSSGEPSESPLADLESNSGEPSQSPPTDIKASLGEPLQSLPTDLEASSSVPSQLPPTDLESSSVNPLKSPPTDLEASSCESFHPPPTDLEASSGELSKSPPCRPRGKLR